jgi:hypothetical protein
VSIRNAAAEEGEEVKEVEEVAEPHESLPPPRVVA